MSPLRTITITAHNRPQLFSNLLDSLRANELAGWHIAIAVEPTELSGEFIGIADAKLKDLDYRVEINTRHLGVQENPFRLLERVFDAGSALNIYLEEDLLVSPDVTRLSEWYAINRRPDWLCLSLLSGGCGSTGMVSEIAHPELLFTAKTFNSIGFVVTRDQWYARLHRVWMSHDPVWSHHGEATGGWDWSVFRLLMRSGDLYSLNPVAARCVHAGREGGVFCTPEFHDRAFLDLPIFEDRAARPRYRVVETAALPLSVARHVRLWAEMTVALAALARKQEAIDRRSSRGIRRKLAGWLPARTSRPKPGKP